MRRGDIRQRIGDRLPMVRVNQRIRVHGIHCQRFIKSAVADNPSASRTRDIIDASRGDYGDAPLGWLRRGGAAVQNGYTYIPR
jgi:hypothetical protein